jgi:arginase family enzyme
VSHLEPGGLTVRQVLDTLAAVKAPALLGADVVELNPRFDVSGRSATVAAKFVRELLAALLIDSAARK